jgi:hypothetical protein
VVLFTIYTPLLLDCLLPLALSIELLLSHLIGGVPFQPNLMLKVTGFLVRLSPFLGRGVCRINLFPRSLDPAPPQPLSPFAQHCLGIMFVAGFQAMEGASMGKGELCAGPTNHEDPCWRVGVSEYKESI